jgi:hypothetical protein
VEEWKSVVSITPLIFVENFICGICSTMSDLNRELNDFDAKEQIGNNITWNPCIDTLI